MDKSYVGVVPETRVRPTISLQELGENRHEYNAHALRQMRSTEFSEDLIDLAKEDAESGYMTDPVPFSDYLVKIMLLSRRIPVREFKQSLGNDRTCPVDHGSEFFLKAATWTEERTQVQGLEFPTTMIIHCYMHGMIPRMWKRDLKSAFRTCPLHQHQVWCSWSAWKVGNEVWMSRHFASPFGWVSSCFSFHRLGEFIVAILVRFLLVPAGRYVDDFYGAGRAGVHWSGGRCMDVMMVLLGFEVDHKKSQDDVDEMVVLGHCVSLNDKRQFAVLRVEHNKALPWRHTLDWILDIGRCPPSLAGKFAGRFNWTCAVQVDKIGRVYIRPWHAQTNAPTIGDKTSLVHKQSCLWWLGFLTPRPVSIKRRWDIQRNHVLLWTDASGVDRWLAVVILHAGRFGYTRWQCSNWLWLQLAEGGDHSIGTQGGHSGLLLVAAMASWVCCHDLCG